MSDIAKCPLCQKYIDVTFNSETCPQCGGNIASYNVKPETHSQYYGVGGWLLLLCVGMTILGPLLNLAAISSEIAESNKISAFIPEIETAVKIEVGVMLVITALGFYAGISLWTKRPNAVLKAKIYLILLPFATILALYSIYMVLPPMVQQPFIRESTFPVIRTVIYSIVWFLYLSNSQRVAETYADA